MATISERLRRLYPMPKDDATRGDLHESADTIDALVAALEDIRKFHRNAEYVRGTAGAALALARR